MEAPYASTLVLAPPSYTDTILADQRVQSTSANEFSDTDTRSEGGESLDRPLITREGDEGASDSGSSSMPNSSETIS